MILVLAFLALFNGQSAVAMPRWPRITCGEYMGIPRNPFAIDAHDTRAILDFVGTVTPLPAQRQSHGMRDAFERFWLIYKPEAATKIKEHLESIGFTAWSYQRISNRGPADYEHARLRYAWNLFLQDVAPDFSVATDSTAAREAHKVRALTVYLNAEVIFTFLSDEFPDVKVNSSGRAQLLFARAYRFYLPESLVKADVRPSDHVRLQFKLEADRQSRVIAAWIQYVYELTGVTKELPPTHEKVRSRYFRVIPRSIDAVNGHEVDSIVAYLSNRYPEITLTDPGAMNLYITAIRRDEGLGEGLVRLKKSDLISGLYMDTPSAVKRIKLAWRELRDDLKVP